MREVEAGGGHNDIVLFQNLSKSLKSWKKYYKYDKYTIP